MGSVSVALFAGMIGCAFAQPIQAAAAYKVLWSFGNGTDGQGPSSALLNVGGVFYGTTRAGGIYGDGTAYTFDPRTDAERVPYAFCIKGEFCLDGSEPVGGLIDVKGKLYGTTAFGGASLEGEGGGGKVFSLDPSTDRERVVYSFCQQANCTDGRYPADGVMDVKGTFYGTTDAGGNGNGRQGFSGTAFALDWKTGNESVLYSFCSQQHCTDGSNLETNALIDLSGTLYGTTGTGGADTNGCQLAGCGTIYAIDPETGAETVLHSFQGGTDGAEPSSGLIDVMGVLYGTTAWGGATVALTVMVAGRCSRSIRTRTS